jgi:zinc D-Ala-D-Ala carboxypeptidase
VTQLSPHFSLEELTATMHRELDNTPSPDVVIALSDTALRLEAVRQLLGNSPLHVNSGYRSPAVNAAVGGVAGSAHLSGHACDFVCPPFGDPIDICRHLSASALEFDQVIEEGAWVHISFAHPMRREVLTKNPAGGYRPGLPPVGQEPTS